MVRRERLVQLTTFEEFCSHGLFGDVIGGPYVSNVRILKKATAGRVVCSILCASQLFGKENCVCNFPHRLATLATLPVHHLISVVFAERKIALQDALCSIDCLASFQSVCKLGIFGLQACTLNFSANEMTQCR